jgi:hypothetical protein
MHYTIDTSYILGDYDLNISEEKRNEYIDEIYKVANDEGKQQKIDYQFVLPKPKISSLQIWEQSGVFNDLLDSFLSYSNYYSIPTQNLSITDCWAVVYKKGDFSNEHAHMDSGALLSFVFYLQNDDEAPIEFIDGNKMVYPKTNTLLLFPPWVRHKVPPLEHEKDRIVLAGNFGKS